MIQADRARAEGPVGAYVRVIVVDDHPLTRRQLSAALDSDSHVVVVAEAASGEEAVRLAGRMAPDVVLMDIRMPPGPDGLESARLIRSTTRSAVVLVSSFDVALYEAAALEAGAARCLPKTATEGELVQAVIDAASLGGGSLS